MLKGDELQAFDVQRGLNRSTFWKSGFRSISANNHKIFIQKRNYIHMNPVRAGLVALPWGISLVQLVASCGRLLDAGGRTSVGRAK